MLGYHVYRSVNGGPFTRMADGLTTETQFVDPTRPPEATTYMVRAITLHVGPSGSYYNASQGAFATVAASPSAAASPAPGGAVHAHDDFSNSK